MTNKVIGITGEEIKKGDWMIRGEDGKYYKLRTKKVRVVVATNVMKRSQINDM